MRYKAVLFDLDGTLINTAPGIIACAKQVMSDMGVPLPDDSIMHRFIGPPLPKCFEAVAGCDEETCQKCAKHYKKIFGKQHIEKFSLYEGIEALLDDLKAAGYKLAVATYKQVPAAYDSLNYFDLTRRFEAVEGSDLNSTFTKGEIIAHAMEKLGVTADECIMIGDSPSDFTGADSNGCDFIAAKYGYGFLESSEIPGVCVAENVEEIYAFLLNNK